MILSDIKCGQSATVTKLLENGAIKRRIMDMGITKGTRVSVVKVAPLGDPIELSVRGYQLSLRKADARLIEVDEVEAPAWSHAADCSSCHSCGCAAAK